MVFRWTCACSEVCGHLSSNGGRSSQFGLNSYLQQLRLHRELSILPLTLHSPTHTMQPTLLRRVRTRFPHTGRRVLISPSPAVTWEKQARMASTLGSSLRPTRHSAASMDRATKFPRTLEEWTRSSSYGLVTSQRASAHPLASSSYFSLTVRHRQRSRNIGMELTCL